MPDQSSAPRPRRRLSAQERRDQICRACADVIADVGYADATLTAITERAGLAKGLLWHYFDDREDVIRQTLTFLGDAIRHAVVTDLDVTMDVDSVLREVFERTAVLTRTHPVELEAIEQIVHNLRDGYGRREVSVIAFDSVFAEHELLLRRGQQSGVIASGELRTMAVLYQGAIDAMLAYLQAHPKIDPQPYSRRMADLLLAGLAAR